MAVNKLKSRGGFCKQATAFGSSCKMLARQATAAISICGQYDTKYTDLAISCVDIASYAMEIQKACLWNERVGGTYVISDKEGAAKRVVITRFTSIW